jgi:hypothetical protein
VLIPARSTKEYNYYVEISTPEDNPIIQVYKPFTKPIKYTFLALAAFLFFVIAVSAYNLWYFGTTKVGPYHINAWQPKDTGEPYFNFGKSSREDALKQLLGELPKDTTEQSSPTNDGQKENVVLDAPRTYPTIDFKTPDNWIVTTAPNGNGFDFESRRQVFCSATPTESLGGPTCKDFTTQDAYDADIDGIVSGHIGFGDVCDSFGSKSWLFCDSLKVYDLKEFIAYKDVLLTSFKWPKTPPCEPTDISNKGVAEVVKIAGFMGFRQKIDTLCLYENYGGSSSLPTTLYYYVPVGGKSGTNLMVARVRYAESSSEALRELDKFEQMLNTMVVKNPEN